MRVCCFSRWEKCDEKSLCAEKPCAEKPCAEKKDAHARLYENALGFRNNLVG